MGERYSTRQRSLPAGFGENIKRSTQCRKAVSVLPLPVGARMSVDSFFSSGGQPRVWVLVGVGKEWRNQSCTAGWKPLSGVEGGGDTSEDS
jgi:hypothetical protein